MVYFHGYQLQLQDTLPILMFKVKPEWGMWGAVSGVVERKRAVCGVDRGCNTKR